VADRATRLDERRPQHRRVEKADALRHLGGVVGDQPVCTTAGRLVEGVPDLEQLTSQPVELRRRDVDQPARQQCPQQGDVTQSTVRLLEVGSRQMAQVADADPALTRVGRQPWQPVLRRPSPVRERRAAAGQRQGCVACDMTHVEQTKRYPQVVSGRRPEL